MISLLRGLIFFCWVSFFVSYGANAKNNPEEDFDELLIYVGLSRYGGTEIPAAIREEKIYLSVRDLFDFLHIKNQLTDNEVIQGYVLNQNDLYTFDFKNGKLTYQGKEHILPPSALIKQDDFLYLNSNLFGEIFGLDCSFNFRSLSVTLTTQLDLPVFRLLRQEMMRKNLSILHGLQEADTAYARKKSMAKLQMADWAVMDTRQLNRSGRDREISETAYTTRFNLSLGGELAHGEVVAHLNFFEGRPIQHRDQFYQWRHVNNDNPLVRQMSVGRINTQSISTILAPIVGLQVTNASTLRRKSFGSYRITDHTEPEWLVELYVNNTMIDFVRADAAGLYTFDVPLIYGNTHIQLKFYGPFGEEQSREQFINIPFNFLPKNELEYTLSSGRVDDEWGSLFSRGSINYGLSRNLTVGGGVEHLSSIPGQNILPFMNTSVKVSDRMMFSGDYMPNVRARGLVNYRLPSDINLDISYTRLDKDQQAIVFNYLEERKVALTMPIKRNNFSMFSRLSLTQMVYTNGKFTNAQLLLSGRVLGIPTNFTTFGTFRRQQNHLHSMVSQTYRLPLNISVMSQVQYNYSARKISNVMVRMEKRVSRRGFFNLFYQNNFMFHNSSLGLGFRYDFSFSNVSMQARQSNGQTILTQTARGSLMYDGNTGHMDFNNKVNVGKGAITVLPFLDLNANGKKDKNESLVRGLKLKVKGGQLQYDNEGEAIRITNLVAYEDYVIELDKSSFDNIAWRIKNARLKIRVDPNQFKKIEVPISVMGEAAGMVFLEDGLNGIGGIKMNFYNGGDLLVQSVLTERDGYFSYMELAPGEYRVRPDPVQLQNLGYIYQSEKTFFTMEEIREGDYLDDLEFILYSTNQVQTIEEQAIVAAFAESVTPSTEHEHTDLTPSLPQVQKKTNLMEGLGIKEIFEGIDKDGIRLESEDSVILVQGNEIIDKNHPDTNYKIQIKASDKMLDGDDPVFKGVEGIDFHIHNGQYKYTYGIALNYDEAVELLSQVKEMGFQDAFIVSFYKRRRLE